jgi:exodeoxyribonuclease VII small subunit|tara:strand:+ start:1212 stop:1424 length:213 start_codon:yes stop_codon:yes gene_type:complete
VSKKNFETSLNKLEEIVESLEQGDLDLDQSIKKFEEGISLYKNCRELLSGAQKKISVLTESLKEEEYNEE